MTKKMESQQPLSTGKLLSIAGLAWLFDAMDVGLLSFINAALKEDWNLTPEQIGWIGSINSIGMAVGAFAFGAMADKIGRKHVFIITLLLFSLASGFSALSTTLAIFLVFRFLIGAGLGGELPVASTYVSESVHPKKRGQVVVLLESFWALGWIVAAMIAYFIIPTYGWRVALLLTAIPALYAVVLRLKLPDTMPKQPKIEKISVWQNVKSVWTKPYVKRTTMLWLLWFSVVFSYYGMFLWLPSVMVLKGFAMIKSFQYVLIMTLAQLPGYFTAAWFIEKFGRKFVLVTYLIGTAVSAYFFGNAETLTMLMTSGILLSFFNLGAWGAMYAYTPEQYPAHIRGTGAGMAASFGRIGGIFGPLMVGYLVAANMSIGSIFSIFAISIFIGVLAVLFLGKETKYTG